MSSGVVCDIVDNFLIYKCPHCDMHCITAIGDLNCRIFRHGYNIITNAQINPHAPQAECELHANDPNTKGCCKPFQIVSVGSVYYVEKCEYI